MTTAQQSERSRHQLVPTPTSNKTDKHVSSKIPGGAPLGNFSNNPAGSSSQLSTAAQPPMSTNRPKASAKSDQTSITSQPRSNNLGSQPSTSSGSGTQSTPAQPLPGGWVERERYEVYTTGSGACYHLNENCYGLRNCRRVNRVDKCPVCFGSNWKPLGEELHAQHTWGDIHRSSDHAREHYRLAVGQSCTVFRACKVCAKGA